MRTVIRFLVVIFACAALGFSYQDSWKGMLVAEPAFLKHTDEVEVLGLIGFREVNVLVEGLPSDLKDSITRDDIERWVSHRIKNMGIRVVTREEKIRAFLGADKSTDERMLVASDRVHSMVYVNVNTRRVTAGAIFANVSVECHRGVFVHPGYFMSAVVWETSGLIDYETAYNSKDITRKAVNNLLDDLEADWKKCNP